MTLQDQIDAVKLELAHCHDVDEAARIWRECREASEQIQRLTIYAAEKADKLSMRTIPDAWKPFVMTGGRK